ncbi:esterase/lipase family protein [Streptomyces sp. NPDC087844]|uniref:esterase/lipase family protein n=1 Tax=Streptomyces sp. NPDC087844 TaxID=3365805 RepID=UPI00382C44E8
MPDLHALPGVSPLIDGYSGLLDWLERHFTLRRRLPGDDPRTPVNLVGFAYDWRLSCRYNAERLAERVYEELGRWRASAPERGAARVVFVCHSMGVLVTRQYVERGGGAEVNRRVVTLGTPYRGSLDALLSLVDGHRPGFGPASLDLTAFARSLPSLHQLTPDYACLAGAPGHAGDTGAPGAGGRCDTARCPGAGCDGRGRGVQGRGLGTAGGGRP